MVQTPGYLNNKNQMPFYASLPVYIQKNLEDSTKRISDEDCRCKIGKNITARVIFTLKALH